MRNIFYIINKFLFKKGNIFLIFFLVFYFLSRLNSSIYFIDIFNQLSFQILLGGTILLFILFFLKKFWSSLICIIICILLAINILPACKHCNALMKDEEKNYNKIRLMTFNTSYGIDKSLPRWFLYLENTLIKNKRSQLNVLEDLEDLYEVILIENPDIIQFQEVTPLVKYKLKSLESIFPYSVSLNKFVGIAESIVFSKYPLKKNKNSDFSNVLTKIIIDETELNFLSVHLYSGINQNRFNLADKQIQIIKNLIKDNRKNIILMGDLNMTPISKRFINFLNEVNLYTYASFLNPTMTWPAFLPNYLGIQIDHVLFSKNFKMINKKTTKSLGSDHRPLIVDLAF